MSRLRAAQTTASIGVLTPRRVADEPYRDGRSVRSETPSSRAMASVASPPSQESQHREVGLGEVGGPSHRSPSQVRPGPE